MESKPAEMTRHQVECPGVFQDDMQLARNPMMVFKRPDPWRYILWLQREKGQSLHEAYDTALTVYPHE